MNLPIPPRLLLAPRRGVVAALRTVTLVCGLVAAPQLVAAQPAAGNSAPAGLVSEVQRLRSELEQVNRDVEALKRGDRGLRDDARLRQRMADAEAVARRLTDAERRLTSFGVRGPVTARPTAPMPNALPSDGPAELSAKADILTDEARRLGREADRMARAADSVRGRDLLRRRVGQLDRDPFAGFESSKRSLAFSSSQRMAEAAGSPPTRGGGTPTVSAPEFMGSKGAEDSVGPPAPASPPSQGVGSGTGGPTNVSPPPGSTATPAPSSPTSPTPAAPSGGAPTPTNDVSTPSLVFRTLLDPATIAELRRIEAQGTAASRAEAFARASAALRARAAALEAEAATLRRLSQQK